jgi:hypothetical protein
MMIGHTGGIDCYGPTGLRMTAIVEEYGKRRLSEGDAGFTWKSWDEIGLVSVREAVAKVTVKPASSRKAA